MTFQLNETMTEKFALDEEKKRAFFVIGQEGSGTYMLANAITEASELKNCMVMRRSVPHAHKWPDIFNIYKNLWGSGYDVCPIVIMREMNSTILSVNRRDESTIIIEEDYHARLAYILQQTTSFNQRCFFITYESFVTSEDYRRWLFEERLNLPYPEDFLVYNGNDKNYSGE